MENRLIQHKAKPSAALGLRPTPRCCFFHTVQMWKCFNLFKAFLVDKLFVLATFSDSKLITHMYVTVLYFPYTVLHFLNGKIALSFTLCSPTVML